MTRGVSALVLSLAIPACTACPKTEPGSSERALPSQGLEIRYQVDAVRPPTRFALTIPPSGDAELLLLGPPAAPQGPRGRFRGPIAAALRQELERQVREGDLLAADPGEHATAEGSGSISLASPDKRVHLGLVSAGPALVTLRARLDTIVRELSAHPIAAVRAEIRSDKTSSGLVPVVDLVHVGNEPFELVLVDGKQTASIVGSVKTATGATRELVMSRADMLALVNAGRLHAGITRLEPGARIGLPFRTPIEPGARVTARVMCWYPGVGKSRSSLVLDVAADLR